MPFFDSKFKSTAAPSGKRVFTFQTIYKQTVKNWNETPPLAVEGKVYYADDSWKETADEDLLFRTLPEETQNPEVCKKVFTTWISDCSGAFVKPPTIEQCLGNVIICLDSNADPAPMLSTEEDSDWVLQWIPTSVRVDQPKFEIHWAPCYKTPYTARIPELTDVGSPTAASALIDDVQVQAPEKTYTIVQTANPRTFNGDSGWLHELNDMTLPLQDGPALRLNTDLDMEEQREKYRRKVRDARLRAKLARYRAERMAKRFEDRFGVYPEEDEEEAQTEVDSDGSD